MWLFRKTLDLRRAAVRPVSGGDLTAVSRLLRDGGRRYYGLSGSDLPALLAAGRGIAMEADGELWGVAVVGQPVRAMAWLRSVALADGVETRAGLELLLPPLHAQLAAQDVQSCYYSGDESSDAWLLPILNGLGYHTETDILVYEKPGLAIPDAGNLAVSLRPVVEADLPEVLRIDAACFEPQWTKDETILGPAVVHGPHFVVAELEGRAVGYAYATAHFGGRLVHLVRIAVDPEYRGQQIGVRLLADVVRFAQGLSANTLTLTTQAYNNSAQRLYRWFGFAATGERQPVLRRSLP